jgi:hypothetical protein
MFQPFPGRQPDQTCRTLLIKGEITQGDSAKFTQTIKVHHPFLDEVDLWSSGGSVEEAIKIGRLIRANLIKTEAPSDHSNKPAGRGWYFANELVPGCPERNRATPPKGAGCQCASACFLILAAGIKRYGSSLGLHRPAIAATNFANMPPDRASTLYRGLLADINKYLSEMEIPPRFAEFMIDVSSKDIRWLTTDEATVLEEVPSINEWFAATCGAMSKEEKDTKLTLGIQDDLSRPMSKEEKNMHLRLGAEEGMFKKPLSPRDKMLYKQLDSRSREIAQCEWKKIRQARETIPKPN